MAQKPKGFSEILRQHQASKQSFNSLEKQAISNYGQDLKFVKNQQGITKISDSLQKLIEPFASDTKNKKELEFFLFVAVIAWNLEVMSDLIPAMEWIEMMNESIADFVKTKDPEQIEFIEDLIMTLIERKEKLFPNDMRLVADFELKSLGKGDYHLSVASKMVDMS